MTTAQTAEAPRDVIFCARTNRIIDIVQSAETASAQLASLTGDYGADLILLPSTEALRRFEDSFKSEPEEITAERFHDMLNILPPVGWNTDSDGECFRISERLAGRITAIFVRIGERYATFADDIRTPHRECCRRAAEFFQPSPLPSPPMQTSELPPPAPEPAATDPRAQTSR